MFRQHAVYIDRRSGERRLLRLLLRDKGGKLLEEIVGEIVEETGFE